MHNLLRSFPNDNRPIVDETNDTLSLIHFNLVRLQEGERFSQQLENHESVLVVLSGSCRIEVDGQIFDTVGQRKDIWSGSADSVYVPVNGQAVIKALSDTCEIAIAGGTYDKALEPFRIRPQEVDMVDVGSAETKTRRRIFHILGKNADGRAGHLLVSELYCDEGCWSGYPSHKHDEENGDKESEFEELYYYRFQPQTGFGGQFVFQPDGSSAAYMTRDGDTFILKKGFHPTVTSPGHDEYIFTIIVGRHRRSLIQHFYKEHSYLQDKIPGLQAMTDKFK